MVAIEAIRDLHRYGNSFTTCFIVNCLSETYWRGFGVL